MPIRALQSLYPYFAQSRRYWGASATVPGERMGGTSYAALGRGTRMHPQAA